MANLDSQSLSGVDRLQAPSTTSGRWDFAAELAAWGPGKSRDTPEAMAARAYCSHVARTHYENFTVVSLFLPRRLVRHFQAVYAYCRWADDLADETSGGEEALRLLDWWREELHACYDGMPRHPVMVALRETVRRFDIPRQPFLDLLSAFEQDQKVKEYDTFTDLVDYCRRSANPVGRLVLYLFHCHDEVRGALSDEVCTGLQLANFWQDVRRDLDMGRIYLPKEDRERLGEADSDLRSRRFSPAFADLMRFEVQRARGCFDRGSALLPLLPGMARLEVSLFIAGGRAILDAVEKQGFDVWSRRPEVSHREKFSLMLRTLWTEIRTRRWA